MGRINGLILRPISTRDTTVCSDCESATLWCGCCLPGKLSTWKIVQPTVMRRVCPLVRTSVLVKMTSSKNDSGSSILRNIGTIIFRKPNRSSWNQVHGMIVVTTHNGSGLIDQSRQGSTALVQIIESDNSSGLIIKLLNAHLTKCGTSKASRATHVESLLREDAVNAWLYARRAVAEMRFQYGLSEFEVLPIEFGRLHYPTGVKSPVASARSLGPSPQVF